MQVYNNSFNTDVKFSLKKIGEAYRWDNNNCNYFIDTMSTRVQVINGTYLDGDYGWVFDGADNVNQPQNIKFLLAFLEIKVEALGTDSWTKYFYWDVRDCQYYPISGCPQPGNSGDITIRINRDEQDIWFRHGYTNNPTPPTNLPNDPNGWEQDPVNGETRRYWEVLGITHCPLTPGTPTGFTLSGGTGAHPVLSWNQNTEEMLDGYKLYREENNNGFNLLAVLDKNTTSYIDEEVIIGSSKFDPLVCYELTAFGKADNESDPTSSECTKLGGMSKSVKSKVSNNEVLHNQLLDAFPNPFNPATTISYSIAESGNVELVIYNLLGQIKQILVDEYQDKGKYLVQFDGSNLPSGTYIYSLRINNHNFSKRLSLIK